MRVRIVVPGKLLLDQETDKITAPGAEGSFQILPRHIDVVSTLQSGILILTTDKKERYFAINQGVLVKEKDLVQISSYQVVESTSLEELQQTVEENFRNLDEQEKKLSRILDKLEADTLIRLAELE
jgi:F-type H+-transporting ATPase subunit epsilon